MKKQSKDLSRYHELISGLLKQPATPEEWEPYKLTDEQEHDEVVINIGTPLVNHALGGAPATAPILSKGAILALTLQLAAEFGKDNIRVNTVVPGVIRTPMHVGKDGDHSDQSAGMHLLNWAGGVEDIAQMVYTVAKSKFITGAIINVDGGMGAGHNLN